MLMTKMVRSTGDNMNKQDGPAVSLPFASFRNISCLDDTENDRKVFAGPLPGAALLKIGTDENVRDNLVDAEGKKKQRRSDATARYTTQSKTIPTNFVH
jgi:hypothetical protein